VSIVLSAFPSPSDLGRIRLAFNGDFSDEFFGDSIWKVKLFDDFDSDPQTEDAEKSDFGISTSIGHLF